MERTFPIVVQPTDGPASIRIGAQEGTRGPDGVWVWKAEPTQIFLPSGEVDQTQKDPVIRIPPNPVTILATLERAAPTDQILLRLLSCAQQVADAQGYPTTADWIGGVASLVATEPPIKRPKA